MCFFWSSNKFLFPNSRIGLNEGTAGVYFPFENESTVLMIDEFIKPKTVNFSTTHSPLQVVSLSNTGYTPRNDQQHFIKERGGEKKE